MYITLGFLIVMEVLALLFPMLLLRVTEIISDGVLDPTVTEGEVITSMILNSLMVLGFIIVIAIVSYVSAFFFSKYSNMYAQNVRRELFNKFQKVSTETIENYGSGKVLPSVLIDTSWIAAYQRRLLVAAVIIPIALFGSLIMMFRLSVAYSLIALAAIPLIAIFYYFGLRRMNKIIPPSVNAMDDFFINVKEGISGAKDIRVLGKAEERARKFSTPVSLQIRQGVNADMLHNLSGAFTSLLFTLITIGIWIYGVNAGVNEMHDLVILNTVIQYTVRMQWASHTVFVWFVEHMPRIWVTKKRFQEIYDLPEVETGAGLTHINKPAEPTLNFSGIEFNWPNGSRGLNLNLTVPYNTRIAIAGGVGSGKSILPKLLLRQAELSGGGINLNGIDISSIDRHYLRREVLAYCGPMSQFINGTIRDNMKVLAPDVSDDEIVEIFEALGAQDFMARFGDSFLDYELNINKRMSDSARNLLGIARCALKPASIHIFNQCFDHVKQEYIANLMAFLKRYKKTCLFISYDPMVCRHCNEVYVLKNGKITGNGNHAELLKENADYKKFYASTSGTIAVEEIVVKKEVEDTQPEQGQLFESMSSQATSAGEVVQ